MGSVNLVVRREGSFTRLYALKRPHAHLRDDPEVVAMFMDEARVAGLLRHPNVVSVVDIGEDAEGPFLVMDYVDGVSAGRIASNAATKNEKVPLEVCLRIGIQVAEGLYAAHRLTSPSGLLLGLVHRDVSPHNILVGYDGIARVSDFGVAKAIGAQNKTSTGILKGKLGYMAPEQLQFLGASPHSDLFAFGVVLFELLTSERLYTGGEGDQTARRILQEPPPDLADYRDDAPPELVELLFQLLAKLPEHRPADARIVARELENILADFVTGMDPPAVETSAYLEAEFGEHRAHRSEEVAAAVEATLVAPMVEFDVDMAVAADARSELARRRRWMWVGAVAVSIVVLGVWLSWDTLSGERSGESMPDPTTPAVADSAARAGERAPGAAALEDVARSNRAADAGPDRAAAVIAPDAGVAPVPRPKTRRRPSTRQRNGDGMGAWDWQ